MRGFDPCNDQFNLEISFNYTSFLESGKNSFFLIRFYIRVYPISDQTYLKFKIDG